MVCVNEQLLDKSFLGRVIDQDFINDLPENVDVCGENGEFHIFTFDEPIFSQLIYFEIGETSYQKYESPKQVNSSSTIRETTVSDPFKFGFWYCDLIPK